MYNQEYDVVRDPWNEQGDVVRNPESVLHACLQAETVLCVKSDSNYNQFQSLSQVW